MAAECDGFDIVSSEGHGRNTAGQEKCGLDCPLIHMTGCAYLVCFTSGMEVHNGDAACKCKILQSYKIKGIRLLFVPNDTCRTNA